MALNPTYTEIIKKTPQQINHTILTAIDSVVNKRTSELSFDKTIIAEVIELIDAESQKYRVLYQGATFFAYGDKGDLRIYDKKENVYVKIPGGDFSAPMKHIEGKAYASAAISGNVEPTDLTTTFVEMGDIFESKEDNNIFSILAGPDEDKENNPYYEKIIYENKDKPIDKVFIDQFSMYKHIQIKADVRTDFVGTQTEGNYGLKIEFYVENDLNRVETRYLNISNFIGSLYSYPESTLQLAQYDMSALSLTALKKITLYQEKFPRYDTLFDIDGKIPLFENKKTPNIFFSNIKINFINTVNLTKNLYYLGIKAQSGTSVGDDKPIKLEGVLYYGNKEIMTETNSKCYWYEQDPTIMQGDPLYDSKAGNGWKRIINSSRIKFNVLTVKPQDVYQMKKIKLIVHYNESTVRSAEIQVKRSTNFRFGVIKEITEDKRTVLTLKDPSTDKVSGCLWYAQLPDGTYLDLSKGKVSWSMDVTPYTIYSTVNIYCAININDTTGIPKDPTAPDEPEKKPDDDKAPIPNEDDKDKDTDNKEETAAKYVPFNYVLKSFVPGEQLKVFFEGPDTFLYDNNGNITYNEAALEKTIIPKLQWEKDSSSAYELTWSDGIGTPITKFPTSIPNSMLTSIYKDSTSDILHFKISPRYNDKSSNNILTCKIKTGQETFEFSKEFVFLKQGDQGTNGSTYSLIIRPCDNYGNRSSDNTFLSYNSKDKKWGDQYYLKAYIYKEGYELSLSDLEKYDIQYQWTGVNIEMQDVQLGTQFIPNVKRVFGKHELNTIEDKGQYFIKCSIKIKDKEKEDKDYQVLSYIYPILIGVNLQKDKMDLLSIPLSVVYNNEGKEPLYNRNRLLFVYDGKKQRSKPESLTASTIKVVQHKSYIEDNVIYHEIEPVNSYDGASFYEKDSSVLSDPMGAIRWNLDSNKGDSYVIQPIAMLLSLSNDKALKGWGGEKIIYIEPAKKDLKTDPDDNAAEDGDSEKTITVEDGSSGEIDKKGRFTNGFLKGLWSKAASSSKNKKQANPKVSLMALTEEPQEPELPPAAPNRREVLVVDHAGQNVASIDSEGNVNLGNSALKVERSRTYEKKTLRSYSLPLKNFTAIDEEGVFDFKELNKSLTNTAIIEYYPDNSKRLILKTQPFKIYFQEEGLDPWNSNIKTVQGVKEKKIKDSHFERVGDNLVYGSKVIDEIIYLLPQDYIEGQELLISFTVDYIDFYYLADKEHYRDPLPDNKFFEGSLLLDFTQKTLVPNRPDFQVTAANNEIDPERYTDSFNINLDPERVSFDSSYVPVPDQIKNNQLIDRQSLQSCLSTPGTPENKFLQDSFHVEPFTMSRGRYVVPEALPENTPILWQQFGIKKPPNLNMLIFVNGLLMEPEDAHIILQPFRIIVNFKLEPQDIVSIVQF